MCFVFIFYHFLKTKSDSQRLHSNRRSIHPNFCRKEKMTNNKTALQRTTAILTALTLTPSFCGIIAQNTNLPLWETSPALAQPRLEDNDSRRAANYRNTSLPPSNSINMSGQITSDLNNNSFEFHAENGTRYRVLALSSVTLRGLGRNDRVQISGKRDGYVFIASSVINLGTSNSAIINMRANIIDNTAGNRFTIRQGSSIRTVVAERGKPLGLRVGNEVVMTGQWRGNIFYASSVRPFNSGGNDNR